ncbi:MAG: DivIVA domain-containing protein [Acidimicrobiales bacterium]
MSMEDVPNESVVEQVSKIRGIRTVEFRQALRGYNIDDVDEYLEELAAEADGVFEQVRQLSEQLGQAHARVSQLEGGAALQVQEASAQVAAAASTFNDNSVESLQRTLIMAQKFVDQAHAEAQEQARGVVAAAENQAQTLLANANAEARRIVAETEGRMKQEVARLEQVRSKLAGEVEAVARHLDGERTRLRGALTEMVAWVDEQFNPAAAMLSQSSDERTMPGGVHEHQSDAPDASTGAGSRMEDGNGGAGSGGSGGGGGGGGGGGNNGADRNGMHGNGETAGSTGAGITDAASRSAFAADLEDPLNLFS